MADVSTLGLGVDSSGVVKASEALEGLSKSAGKAAGAATEVEGSSAGMATSMMGAVAKGTMLADALEATAKFAVDLTKRMFELAVELGRFQDMAEATQADPAGLASMQVAADVAGVSMDTVAMSMNRLSATLAGVEDDGKAAGKALESIGIEIEAFKALTPDKQYRQIAVALEEYGSSGTKVAAVQALMGRGSGQQLKLMHELATETEQSTLVTNEMIKSMDDFADSNKRASSQLQQMLAVVMTGSVPAITVLKQTTITAVQQLFNLDKGAGALAAQSGIKSFTEGAVKAIGFLVDVLEAPIRLFRVLGTVIGGVAASAVAVASGELSQARSILSDVGDTVDAILLEKSFGQKLKDRMAEENAKTPEAAEREKPKIDYNPNKEKKAKDVYNDLMLTLQKKLDLQQEDLTLGRKLTDEEKLRIDVLATVKRSKQELTTAELGNIDAMLKTLGIVDKQIEAREKLVKAEQAYSEEMRGIVEGELKRRDAMVAVREKEEEAFDNYGKTVWQLQDLEIKKMRDTAATLRQAAVIAGEYNPAAAAQVRLMGQQADELDRAAEARDRLNKQERADSKSVGFGAKRAVEEYLFSVADMARETEHVVGGALKRTEDMMTDLFMGKKVDVRAFIDNMLAEFMRLLVVRPLMASILGSIPGMGGGGGGLGSLLGLFGAGGAASTGAELSAAAGLPLGTFAEGGRPTVGEFAWVGEKGPELWMSDKAGTIIPNDKLNVGGKQVTISPTYVTNIDARTDMAQIRTMVEQSHNRNNKVLMEHLKAQGVF